MNKVIVICGPTCVGKTKVSVELAKRINAEIINGDSMQVYKEMNIGTAKIQEDEKDGVIHHLFDIKTINDNYSIAEYQTLVREKIEEISLKNKSPIIVGGSGLYLKSALYDYDFSNQNIDLKELNQKSTEELGTILKSLDIETYNKIDLNNAKRIKRAIEIYYENGIGKEKNNKKQTHEPIFELIFIGLTKERSLLYKQIDDRVDEMVKNGLLEEAKNVYYNATSLTARQAIGYKEFYPFFKGEDTLENCIQKVKSNTHKYVKRQYTWFNHQVQVNWVDVEGKNSDEIVQEILNKVGEVYGEI